MVCPIFVLTPGSHILYTVGRQCYTLFVQMPSPHIYATKLHIYNLLATLFWVKAIPLIILLMLHIENSSWFNF